MANIHDEHRKRVKEEFRKSGLEHFPHHKLFEMLLFYSIPRGDTNELGHLLMERFGSVSGVFDAPYQMLREVKGIGPESATLIKFVSDMMRMYLDDYTAKSNMIDSPQAAKDFMRFKFICEQTECIYMVCLGNNNKVLYCERIARGLPETVGVEPAKVVKTALRSNAVKVVIAHNHPNGICIPSNRDLRTTTVLLEELMRVDVELMDHIVVAPDGEYSMAENNMIKSR